MDESNSPEAWYRRLPPITKWMTTATFAMTLLYILHLLPGSLVILDMRLVVTRLHVWRLLTNFLFLGRFSFGWLLHMYLFCQFSAKLERSPIFEQYVSGYLSFMLFQMLMLDALSVCLYYPSGMPQLAASLVFAILYYWSRREPYAQVGIWGFTVEAYKFPFCLMLLDVMMGNSVMFDILGLLSGHCYYFLREVLPAEGGSNWLEKPPVCLDKLMASLLSLSGTASSFCAPGSSSRGTTSGRTSRGGWGGGGSGTTTSAMGGNVSGGGIRFWGSGQVTQRNREFSGPGYRLGGGAD